MEIYKLDRIEDGIAVVEDPSGNFLRLSEKLFPEGSKSGDCFKLIYGMFIPIEEETIKYRKRISAILSELKE